MASAPELQPVVQALDAAMNWASTAEVRRNATAFLEQVKASEPRSAVQLGLALAGGDKADHVRLFGIQLLQAAVSNHWASFSEEDHQQLSKLSFDLLMSSASPGVDRSLRSKAAALLADMVRQSGPLVWEALLPALVNLSTAGPIQAEAAALVLQFLPEDITVHNEGLDVERRRQWLVTLTSTLPQVLPFLRQLLESNFTAALAAIQKGDVATGRSHAAAASAALTSAGAYAEWAPVSSLGATKLVDACGYLLNATEFRMSACDFLRHLGARRRQQEDPDAFDSALSSLFSFSLSAARASIARLSQAPPSPSEGGEAQLEDAAVAEEVEFMQNLLEVFVALTPTNLHRLAVRDEGVMQELLQVLLLVFSHNIFSLHSQSLPLWTLLLRESAASSGAPVASLHAPPRPPKDPSLRSPWCVVPPDHCVALLDVVVRRLQQAAQGQGLAAFEEDELFGSGSVITDYTQYRSRLLDVVRLVAAQQPLAAACKATAMLDLGIALAAQDPNPDQKLLATVEASQIFLECVIGGIPEPAMVAAAAFSTKPGVLCDELSLVLEGLVTQLVDLEWPFHIGMLVEIQAHLLDSMGPYCRHNPNAAGKVAGKLFAILRKLPPVALGAEPLGRPEKAEMRLPRLQVCTSVLRLCRHAAPSLAQHLKSMVDSVTQVGEEAQAKRGGRPLAVTGETILLGEALILVAAATGTQEESMVLEWLFAPVRQKWTDPVWQQQVLKDPPAFTAILAHAPGTPQEDEFWFLYHCMMLFERSMRRVGPPPVHTARAGPQGPVICPMPPSVPWGQGAAPYKHPAALHLSWILPPVAEVLRLLHSLWRPDVRSFLPPLISESLEVGAYEQAVLLGMQGQQSQEAARNTPSRERADMVTRRNWLKGMRDNGYGFLGMAATNAPESLFGLPPGVPQQLTVSFLESLTSMEQRHLRLLLKSVGVPVARGCPKESWRAWLGPTLPPLLQHCGAVLSKAWQDKGQQQPQQPQGDAPGLNGAPQANSGSTGAASAMRQEMYEDKMLRDLSREFCQLISLLPLQPGNASVTAGSGASNGPAGGAPQRAAPAVPGSEIGRPDSLFWFLLRVNPDAMLAVLAAGIESMDWPDSEAAHKGISFCSGIVSMPEILLANLADISATSTSAASSANPGSDPSLLLRLCGVLRDSVGRAMFSAAVSALTLESNAFAQADLLGLLRDIYFRLALAGLNAAPKEVILSLPGMNPSSLESFEANLKRSGSPKEQRASFKSLLVGLGGGQLKALAAHKNPTTITNVSGYVKRLSYEAQVAGQMQSSGANTESSTSIGLASLGTTN